MKYLILLALAGCATPVYRPAPKTAQKTDEQIAKERVYLPLFGGDK